MRMCEETQTMSQPTGRWVRRSGLGGRSAKTPGELRTGVSGTVFGVPFDRVLGAKILEN